MSAAFAATDAIGAGRLAAAERFSHIQEVLHHRPQTHQLLSVQLQMKPARHST
jgi:hypothetical protein